MPSSNFYAGMPLDRADQMRRDENALAVLRRHPRVRVLPVWRYRHPLTHVSDAMRTPRPLWQHGPGAHGLLSESWTWVLLGIEGDVPHFAVDVSAMDESEAQRAFAAEGAYQDLRAIGPLLDRAQGSVMAYARGLLYWHARHGFCGVCGHPTRSVAGGHVRRCTNVDCATDHFPRTDPAIIVLVAYQDHCLLGRQSRFPPGMHSTLAGFVEPGESLEETVCREVFEEAGVRVVGRPVYQSSQPWPFPASLMLGFIAEAEDMSLNVDTNELESAGWFARAQLLCSPEDESFRLPRKDSIARRLVDDWLFGRMRS